MEARFLKAFDESRSEIAAALALLGGEGVTMVHEPEDDWLDTETQACLARVPGSKLAPPATVTYALVVLDRGRAADRHWQAKALHRVLQTSLAEAQYQTVRNGPFVLRNKLSLTEAMFGQFELISADIISVFIADEVMDNAKPSYLAALFRDLRASEEFALVTVSVVAIPDGQPGDAFFAQFLGVGRPALPHRMETTRKKARIMTHWAAKLGGAVSPES